VVESEDALWQTLLALKHLPLLRHIRLELLSAEVGAAVFDNRSLCSPIESTWQSFVNRLTEFRHCFKSSMGEV
jgi:hypothetical protein